MSDHQISSPRQGKTRLGDFKAGQNKAIGTAINIFAKTRLPRMPKIWATAIAE